MDGFVRHDTIWSDLDDDGDVTDDDDGERYEGVEGQVDPWPDLQAEVPVLFKQEGTPDRQCSISTSVKSRGYTPEQRV